MTNRDQRHTVRELARRVAEIAESPGNAAIVRRWRDTNARRRPDRPPVWCRPVGAWSELLPESALRCDDPWLRSFEREFRRTLVKHDIGDDSPVEGTVRVPAVLRCDPPDVWGMSAGRRHPDSAGGSWAYDPPLVTDADFDRLRLPRMLLDEAATAAALERTGALLGDLLPVKAGCGAPLDASLCTTAAELRGLGPLLLDLIDAPERVHRLMGHLRDGVLAAMDDVEAMGILTPNHNGPMTGSDPLETIGDPLDGTERTPSGDSLPSPSRVDSSGHSPSRAMESGGAQGRATRPVTYRNLWVMANSQEFDPVSPEMWERYLLDYQRPVLDRFGAVAYGCCENLTRKLDGVLSLPRLRIVVCSAWTSLDRVVDRVGAGHVIMWRQRASDVVMPDDPSVLRHDLAAGLRRLRGCHVQIVLRELQTLAGHPDRLRVWTRIAIEEAERFAA